MDHKALNLLEEFFFLIDSEKLFESIDPSYYIRLRKEIFNALIQLLVWERPFLESAKGLPWPYEALKKRAHIFEDLSRNGKQSFIRRQATIFLALLPFPGQWTWMIRAERELRDDSEVDNFFKIEKQKIQEKTQNKLQRQYLLRHFCQILKKPRLPDEKGVLRIFSIPYLLTNPDLLSELNRLYFFYLEPAAGVIFRHTWWRYFSTLEAPPLFGVGSKEDAAFLQSQPGVLTTNLAHGDFLENEVSVTHGKQKHFDIVFNGTFDQMSRKRHKYMLELLRHPLLNHTTALFLGRGKEGNVKTFQQHVQQSGLADRVTVLSNIPRVEVPKWLAKCRMGVHLALHENVCRCIYEFFRSDLPCVISSSMAGINMEIFNSRTGMAVPDHDLPESILKVLHSRKNYDPRNWFLNNSGSLHSTRKLNEQLKAIFQNRRYKWRQDIVPMLSSGASRYLKASHYERFRPEFEGLREIFKKHPQLPINLSAD